MTLLIAALCASKPASADFAVLTSLMSALSYFACTCLSLTILEFGTEIDIVSVHRLQRLWRLSIRYSLFSLIVILILTPAAVAFLAYLAFQHRWAQAIMLGLDVFLLQILFCLIIVTNRVGAIPPPLRQIFRYAMFPIRLPMVFWRLGFAMLWLASLAGPVIWKYGGEQLFAQLDFALNWLLRITGIGPLLVYVISPFFLLFDPIRKSYGQPDLPLLWYFAGATILVSAALATRLYSILWRDWVTGREEAYNQWLEVREQILSEIIAASPHEYSQSSARHTIEQINDPLNLSDEHEETDWDESEENESSVGLHDELRNHTSPVARDSEQYVLPAGMTGEEFIISLAGKAKLLSQAQIAILIIALIAVPVWGKSGYGILLLLWFIFSSFKDLSLSHHCMITPQNPWRYIRNSIIQTMPFALGDLILAVIAVAMFPIGWFSVIFLTVSYFGFRLMILAIKITAILQLLVPVVLTILAAVAYVPAVLAATSATGDSPVQGFYKCLALIIPMSISWLITVWGIRVCRCNLAHYENLK